MELESVRKISNFLKDKKSSYLNLIENEKKGGVIDLTYKPIGLAKYDQEIAK